jgi:hypothetical protein
MDTLHTMLPSFWVWTVRRSFATVAWLGAGIGSIVGFTVAFCGALENIVSNARGQFTAETTIFISVTVGLFGAVYGLLICGISMLCLYKLLPHVITQRTAGRVFAYCLGGSTIGSLLSFAISPDYWTPFSLFNLPLSVDGFRLFYLGPRLLIALLTVVALCAGLMWDRQPGKMSCRTIPKRGSSLLPSVSLEAIRTDNIY